MQVRLIAPSGIKYDSEANKVILPSVGGQISILPKHMDIISLLAPGEIIIHIGAQEKILVTEGGIVQVFEGNVDILADTAEEVSSIDELKIEEAKKKAEQLRAQARTDIEYADATALLEKQIAKINILKKRKRKYQ